MGDTPVEPLGDRLRAATANYVQTTYEGFLETVLAAYETTLMLEASAGNRTLDIPVADCESLGFDSAWTTTDSIANQVITVQNVSTILRSTLLTLSW